MSNTDGYPNLKTNGMYKNIMEDLVEEEILRQLRRLPARTAASLDSLDLLAYALNQLPTLYATTEEGARVQRQQGGTQFASQIQTAVRRAIAAVQRDPIPSQASLPSEAAIRRNILLRLRLLLNNERLDWETLPTAIEQAMAGSSKRVPSPTGLDDHHPSAAHGSTDEPTQYQSGSDMASFDWDDPLYLSH